ncbi:MAG: hypothetical protein ACHQFZ_04835 [Acidimicrobiales bacterium]
MRSIDERLAASDPAARGYTHPRFDAMLLRVVATPTRRDAAWRAFRLRVAAALAGTGLLTGAGIAALSTAGVSLPVLSFAASVQHAAGANTATKTAPSMMLMPLERNWQFTGADNFSSAPGSATVYSLSAPGDLAGTLAGAAQILGVDAGTPATSDGGASYTSAGPTYSGWLTANGGFASWGISLNDQSATASSSGSVASDAFNATALADARALGSFQLGAPTSSAPGGDTTAPVDVTVPILVDGRATEFAYDFTFGADGTLVSAAGVSFALSAVGAYPLISPAAGVDQISAQLYVSEAFAGGLATPMLGATATPPSAGAGSTSPVGASDSTSPTSTPPDTTPTTADATTTTMPPVVVNLTDESTQYGAYSMTDGSTLLLPVYVYTGDVVDQGWQASFRVVPVDPAYLDLSMVVSPRIY